MTATDSPLAALLALLDAMEAPGFSAGRWVQEPEHVPYFVFDEAVVEFQQALYDGGWVLADFDWTNWQESASDYVDAPEKLGSAELETVKRLLTTHLRKERFCEGHLAAMFDSGHMLALLRRARILCAP